MLEQDLDTRIEVEAGLTLIKRESIHVNGHKSMEYGAKLNIHYVGTKSALPEGVLSHGLRDIEFSITEEMYEAILKQRGEGIAYGRIIVHLYSRTVDD